MSRVLAQATVELLEEGSTSVWEVDVTGHLEGEEGRMHRF